VVALTKKKKRWQKPTLLYELIMQTQNKKSHFMLKALENKVQA
jgi:hypothetical protein